MRVRMTIQITGTRDGAYWPAPGGEIDLPEVEAAKMCAAQYATPVKGGDVETATVDSAPRPRKARR